nr:MAG TPA: hypothetical protein [Caudoviricetes sp.]
MKLFTIHFYIPPSLLYIFAFILSIQQFIINTDYNRR